MTRQDPRLNRTSRRIDNAERVFARELFWWVREFGLREIQRAIKNPKGYVRKDLDDEMERKLRDLIARFGIRQIDGAGKATGASMPNTFTRDALAGKEVKIQLVNEWMQRLDASVEGIALQTQSIVRNAVKDVLQSALSERPQPNTREIANRIKAKTGNLFSFERAQTIARTELAQAENTGIMAGYEMTGVKEIEWLAFSDGRSGDRHHERMNGERIKVGEMFKMPSGKKLRYPGDPMGPISETINCRCTIKPVRR